MLEYIDLWMQSISREKVKELPYIGEILLPQKFPSPELTDHMFKI